jgi:hypothetical protein
MFCPKCKAEFCEGVTWCRQCDVALVTELPPDKPKGTAPASTSRPANAPVAAHDLIKLASFLAPLDAYLVRMRLEATGIKCFIFDENLIEMNWFYSNAVGGVKIYINRLDWEKAQAIMADEPKENQ